MKTTFNLTFCQDELHRYAHRKDFLSVLEQGFDGIELTYYEEDSRSIVPVDKIIGLHMSYFPSWLDFWRGDKAALIAEYGSLEECYRQFGGCNREALLQRFRKDLQNAKRFGVEYVVFHVSDAHIAETFSLNYAHRDEEVIDGACQIINALTEELDGSIAFLMENLWQPGLRFTRPEMTRRLLDGVNYPNKGIMLDTGHLLHCNTQLRSQEEALDYIHAMLDTHGELCEAVCGVHLHQSLTGDYCETVRKNPPVMKESYAQRLGQMFEHAFAVDQHLPFTCEGVDRLIQRIQPEYLTFEFITESRAQHDDFLRRQQKALGKLKK